MKYVPALDGLRAVAVLLVLLCHCFVPGFGGGFIGVDVFFVLSGYLITKVLLKNGDLKTFYIHRMRRLVPGLTLMLLAYIPLYIYFHPEYDHIRDAAIAFFYLSDYAYAYFSIPEFIGHTWSLSVEEHFYLIWPFLLARFNPKLKALVIAYLVFTLWRWSQFDWADGYFRFDTHCTGLILGCILGLLPEASIPKFPAWPGLVVIALAASYLTWQDMHDMRSGITLAELASAVVILGQKPAWLSSRPLVYLGKLSYGIYLWHYMIFRLVYRVSPEHWAYYAAITLAASIAMAAVSYHFVELRFRRRNAPATAPAGLQPSAT